MFPIHQFSYAFLRRIYSCSCNRYLSTTTNDLINNSSSDKTKQPPVNSTSWATSDTNGLIKQLSARIKAGGPITIAEFMLESLLNPKYVRYVL
jgi:hypothetical protein